MSSASVPAEVPDITLEEVLAIKHPSPAAWSSDGAWLAWLWNDGGLSQLWCAPAEGGAPIQLSSGPKSAGGFQWSSDGRLVYTQGGDLWTVRPGEEPRQLTRGGGTDAEPRWSPDGSRLAFSRDGALWVYDFRDGCLSVLPLPAPVVSPYADGIGIRWSPGGSRLAVCVVDNRLRDLLVVDTDGRLLWRTTGPDLPWTFAWVDEQRLHYTNSNHFGTWREQRLVDLGSGEDRLLLREESKIPLKRELDPLVLPGGAGAVYVAPVDRWRHLVHVDLTTGERRQLTGGACEDAGYSDDALSCSPDGRRVVFSSNRETGPNQRRLWAVDVESGDLSPLTAGPGTDCDPKCSPCGRYLAFIHCGPYQSADLWVARADGTDARQITRSMPASLTPSKITVPTHVTYPSEDGLSIHADLFLPKGFDPGRKYPAVVWVHGGMFRQMRYGWHPLRTYGIFYSIDQYLLHRGYVVLSVDYRGSVGYGQDYEEATHMVVGQADLADVAAGATYLRSLGYVDPEAIGVYGISYGGYLTLGAMTKHPEAFAVGVNIAGIWIVEQYDAWREEDAGGRHGFGAFRRLGNPKDPQNAEAWRQASPANFVEGMKNPLLNLHGTADGNVDFAQMDVIIRDCVKHGKDFDVMYYPGEAHTFIHRRTWADAIPRIERAFEGYLKRPKEAQ